MTKHLPDDWEERLDTLPVPTTGTQICAVLDINPDRLWYIRKGDEIFDAAFVAICARAKSVYDGSRIPKPRKPSPSMPKRKPTARKDHIKEGPKLPLIDEENLQREMHLACLVITSLTKHDRHEITLNEIRRWGALLALAHDQIGDKRQEIIKLKREVADLRVQLHRLLSPQAPKAHANGAGVAFEA